MKRDGISDAVREDFMKIQEKRPLALRLPQEGTPRTLFLHVLEVP